MSSTKNNRITLRLDDELLEDVSAVAERLKISKSDVIRLTLRDALDDIPVKDKPSMPQEDRNRLIEVLEKSLEKQNELEYQIKHVGINLNQITKAHNAGKKFSEPTLFNELIQEYRSVLKTYNLVREDLNKIWQSLV